jgi:hypothetical protein
MADLTALYSLVSGIGGALIGGVAGVYGPGRIDKRRREHELVIESQRRQSEAEAQARASVAEERRLRAEEEVRKERAELEEKQKVLAAIAQATVALQDWHRLITWALQDLDAGREFDAARFDESAESVMHSVVEAVSLVSNESFRSMAESRYRRGARGNRDVPKPVTVEMHRVTQELRQQLLVQHPDFAASQIRSASNEIRDDLMKVFMRERTQWVAHIAAEDQFAVFSVDENRYITYDAVNEAEAPG